MASQVKARKLQGDSSMRQAVAHLESISPYSQSKPFMSERGKREAHDEFEKRVWRERMHSDPNGMCYIPPTAPKIMIAEAAKFTPRTGPTGGKSTWTKNFEAGIMVVDPIPLNAVRDEVKGEWVHVPSNGQRGGGKRVWKCFPFFPSWSGDCIFQIFDDSITEDIFDLYLREAGAFIGLGRFRPRNLGHYGRFKVNGIDWIEG